MIDRREAVKRITALLGGAISAPTLAGVLGGCQAPGAGAALRSLSSSQKELLDVLTEHIIPATDSPGALAARVPEFIDAMLADFYSDEERENFYAGLAEIDERAQEAYGGSFLDAAETDQFGLLTAMDEETFPDLDAMTDAEREAYRQRRQQNGRPFFATLKELTITGYYTSEVGATQELRVNPLGVYRGDIPYDEVGRAWA